MDARVIILNDHHQLGQPSTSQTVIRLENPRPNILRANNDYIAVQHNNDSNNNGSGNRDDGQRKLSHLLGRRVNLANLRTPVRIPSARFENSDFTTLSDLNFKFPESSGPYRTCSNRSNRNIFPNNVVKLKSAPPSLIGVDDKNSANRRTTRAAIKTTATPPKRRTASAGGNVNAGSSSSSSSSIICPRCGKCRCVDCAKSRKLPSKYFCRRNCLCSVENAVDFLSCACCVKGCAYHAGWGQSPKSRWARILCYVGACFCLPCFWCYLPLKGLSTLCSACYSRYYDNGCRCTRQEETPSAPQKRTNNAQGRQLERNRIDQKRLLLVKSYSTGSDVQKSIDRKTPNLEILDGQNEYVVRTPLGRHCLDSKMTNHRR